MIPNIATHIGPKQSVGLQGVGYLSELDISVHPAWQCSLVKPRSRFDSSGSFCADGKSCQSDHVRAVEI